MSENILNESKWDANLYSFCRAVFSKRAGKPPSGGRTPVPLSIVLCLSQPHQDSAVTDHAHSTWHVPVKMYTYLTNILSSVKHLFCLVIRNENVHCTCTVLTSSLWHEMSITYSRFLGFGGMNVFTTKVAKSTCIFQLINLITVSCYPALRDDWIGFTTFIAENNRLLYAIFTI